MTIEARPEMAKALAGAVRGANGLGAFVLGIAAPPPAVTVPTAAKEIHDNDGDIPHLVAASDPPFLSEALDSGDTHAFTSTKAGAFACNRDLHPREQGRITATR